MTLQKKRRCLEHQVKCSGPLFHILHLQEHSRVIIQLISQNSIWNKQQEI
jgi:hypothetical protein